MGGRTLRQQQPVVFQMDGGRRVPVRGRYEKSGAAEVAFALDRHDPALPLTIDPVLVWSTYLSGNGRDELVDIAVDEHGNTYATGTTAATNFPTLGTQWAQNGIWVARFDAAGQMDWCSFVGGGNSGFGPAAIAVNAFGVFVVGSATGGMPVTPNAQKTAPESSDGFVVMIGDSVTWPNPTAGPIPFYCTYFGGSGRDEFHALALPFNQGSFGSVMVTGWTESMDYPTTPSPLPIPVGSAVAVSVIHVGAALLSGPSVKLGLGDGVGTGIVQAQGSQEVIVVGRTRDPAFQASGTFSGPEMTFVCRTLPAPGPPLFARFLGGSGFDTPRAVVRDDQDNIWVVGSTTSPDFPVHHALIPQYQGGEDGFVTMLDINGTLVWSTFLGGNSVDRALDVCRDPAGNLLVAGATSSANFPLLDPLMAKPWGQGDGFVTKLASDGSAILGSTLFGGSDSDEIRGIAVHPGGDVAVGGVCGSDLPLHNAWQPQHAGASAGGFQHGLLARLSRDTMPHYGTGTTGPSQALPVLSGGFLPRIGSTVAFEVRGGRGGAFGVLAIGFGRANTPFANGTLLVQDPVTWALLQLQGPNQFVPHGFARVDVAIPPQPDLVGLVTDWQAGFFDTQPGTLAMSNGVEMVILP